MTDINIDQPRAPQSMQRQNVAIMDPNPERGMITVTIDGIDVTVPHGTTLLEAARKIGIRIPTLCYHEDLCTAGVCRICVVQVEGQHTLQASCAYPITGPLKVSTHTKEVRTARRHVVDLLLSEHYGSCTSCARNLNCELQSLAKEYGVDSYRFGHPEEPLFEIDDSSYSVVRDMNKCVHCRRCVRTCIDLQEVGALEAVGRGHHTRITTFMDKPLADVVCVNCGQCINRCPTGALKARGSANDVWAAIEDPTKHVVLQTAPAPRAAIGEAFGFPAGTAVTYELNSAMRLCGFDRIFDTNFAADLTIMEEGSEFLSRAYRALAQHDPEAKFPMFTSCSPGWVKFIEHFYPEYLPHLSSCKSPQQMFGAVIKTHYAAVHGIDPQDIVTVALMPCSAKKFECNRPEMNASGYKDVDYGLTAREMAKMITETGIDMKGMPPSGFDQPFGDATGSGVIFGASGGVMESALRTILELASGVKIEKLFDHANIVPVRGFEGVRHLEIKVPQVGPVPDLLKHVVPSFDFLEGATLRFAVVHGTANARKVMENIKAGGRFAECHFIEFMACPGGCLGGGGQPIPTSPEIRAARARAIYAEDARSEVRKSYENPAIAKIYADFLKDGPGGHRSHELLHTTYTPRGKYIP